MKKPTKQAAYASAREIAGVGLVTVGLAQIYAPLAWLTVGVYLVLASIVADRRAHR